MFGPNDSTQFERGADVALSVGKWLWGFSGLFALWVVSRLRRADGADREQQVRAIVKDEIRGLDTSVGELETKMEGVQRTLVAHDTLLGEYKDKSDDIKHSLEAIQAVANNTAGMVKILVNQSRGTHV